MYSQNNGSGAQWVFATIIVIVVLSLVLGILISGAEWLQPQIGDATAQGISLDNDLEYQKGLLELETLKANADANQERTRLLLEDQKVASQQWAIFREGFYEMINISVLAVVSTLCLSVLIFSMTKSVIAYTAGKDQFKTATLAAQPYSPQIRQYRPRSEAARKAREVELRQLKAKAAIKHTMPFYPDSLKDIVIENYPWAN